MNIRRIIAASVTILVLLIAGIIILYARQQDSDQQQVQSTDTALSELSKALIVVSALVKSNFPEYKVTDQPQWTSTFPKTEVVSVPGFDYKVAVGYSPAITISPASKAIDDGIGEYPLPGTNVTQVVNAMTAVLEKQGFSDMAVRGTNNYRYYRSGQTCVSEVNLSGYIIQVTCNSPDLNRSRALTAQPLIKAYLKAHPTIKSNGVTLGGVQIKSQQSSDSVISASKSAGYDIGEATLKIGDQSIVALFYQQGNDNWQYVTSAKDEYGFSCDDMKKNAYSRKALFDQVCYQSGTGQVRLDTNNQALR